MGLQLPQGHCQVWFSLPAESRKGNHLPDMLRVWPRFFSEEPMGIGLEFRRKVLPCGIKMPRVKVATSSGPH